MQGIPCIQDSLAHWGLESETLNRSVQEKEHSLAHSPLGKGSSPRCPLVNFEIQPPDDQRTASRTPRLPG